MGLDIGDIVNRIVGLVSYVSLVINIHGYTHRNKVIL